VRAKTALVPPAVQFECTRLIIAEQVIGTIRRVPAFAERAVPRLVPAAA
jgi:hypothetical protein